MPRKPTGRPRGRPRTRESTPEIEHERENARRYYYGQPPLPPLPRVTDRMTPEAVAAKRAADARRRHYEAAEVLGRYKLEKQCADCDRRFTKSYHLDFDHRPEHDKSFTLSRVGNRPWSAIWAEVAKCDVVCALCHRDRTFSRAKDRGGHGWVQLPEGQGHSHPTLFDGDTHAG